MGHKCELWRMLEEQKCGEGPHRALTDISLGLTSNVAPPSHEARWLGVLASESVLLYKAQLCRVLRNFGLQCCVKGAHLFIPQEKEGRRQRDGL